MTTFFAALAFFLVVVLLIPFYRIFKGPTVFDRLLGAAAVAAKTITLVLLTGFIYGRVELFIDISLGYAILGFLAMIAMAKYYDGRDESAS
jgi:multicomponent Na+:H+ antiporter subunit F